MAGKIRRIDFSPSEWLEGTAELDNATRGLYITACALIYARGGAVTLDLLKANSRDHGHAFNRQFGILVSLDKLTVNGEQITNKRCANELQKAEERTAKASQNGTKGNEIKKVKNATRSLDSDANHQPSTINHHKEGSVGSDEPTGGKPPSPARKPEGETVVPFRMPEPDPDPKRELYRLGKKILGSSAGGQITKALAKCDGDVERVLHNLRLAELAVDPKQYFAAIVRGERQLDTDWFSFYRAQGLPLDECGTPPAWHPLAKLYAVG